MANNFQYEISQSFTGSFSTKDTIEFSFQSMTDTARTKFHSKHFVDVYYSSSDSSGYQRIPSTDLMTFPKKYAIGTAYNKKSFVFTPPSASLGIKAILTGSIGKNIGSPDQSEGAKPQMNIDFDDFKFTVEKPKVEFTDKGMLVYASPSQFIKATTEGLEIRGGDLTLNKITTDELEIYGDVTVFGDLQASSIPADSTDSTIVQDVGTANAAGSSTSYARANHVHDLPFTTLNTVAGEGLFSALSSSIVSASNVEVSGQLRVPQLFATIISSSVIENTGSTSFGSSSGDTHEFTGSMFVSHSLNVVGTSVFTGDISASGYLSASSLVADTITIGGETSIGASLSVTNITASGDISASGKVIADSFESTGENISGITFADDLNITGDITASGDISASGTGSFTHISLPEVGKIQFDSTDTSIYTNSDDPEDLYIDADEDIYIRPDDNLVIAHGTTNYVTFRGNERAIDIAGNITASGNISGSKQSTGSFGQLEVHIGGTADDTLTISDTTTGIGRASISSTGTLFLQQGSSQTTQIGGDFIPSSTRARDLGSITREFQEAYIVSSSVSQSIVNDNLVVGGAISASGNLISNTLTTPTSNLTLNSAAGDVIVRAGNTSDIKFQENTLGGIVEVMRYDGGDDEFIFSKGLDITGNITASNDISASGTITAEHLRSSDDIVAVGKGSIQETLAVGTTTHATNMELTVAGDISSSGDIYLGGNKLRFTGPNNHISNNPEGTINITTSGVETATFTGTTSTLRNPNITNTISLAGTKIVDTDRSLQNLNHITASGNISASGNLSNTGNLDIDGTTNLKGIVTLQERLIATNITASNISASGTIIADTFKSTGENVDGISFADDLNLSGNLTSSGDISSSGNFDLTGNANIDGTTTIDGKLTVNNDIDLTNDIRLANTKQIQFENAADNAAAHIRNDGSDNLSLRLSTADKKFDFENSSGTTIATLGGSSTLLDVTGDIKASGRVYIGDGAEATPSLAFGLSGQEDTGIYRRADGVIGFSAGGDGQVTISPTGMSIGETYHTTLEPSTANSLIVEGNIGIGTHSPGANLDIRGNQILKQSIGTGSFASGFAGSGWRIDKTSDKWGLTIDELTVRGQMSVYELMVQQVRATNGSLWVSSTGKIVSASIGTEPSFSLFFDTGSNTYGHGFREGDLIRAQRYQGNDSFQSDLIVVSVGNSGSLVAITGSTATTPPSGGFEYVRIGNTVSSSRQGAVYLTADDDDAPYIDVVDGVATHSQFNSSNNVKVRLGKLDGLTDSQFPDLATTTNNYGLYSENVYLKGGIRATFGEIGGYAITSTAISSSDDKFVLESASGSVNSASIKLGSSATAMTFTSGVGTFLDGHGKARFGNPTGDNIKFDGSNVFITSSNFNIQAGGTSIATNNFELDATGLELSSQQASMSLGEGKIILSGSTIPVIKIDGGEISASHFFVDTQGQLTASAGKIGGFIIDSTTLFNSKVTMSSADGGGIFISGSSIGHTGIQLSSSGEFHLGNGTSQGIRLQNNSFQITSSDVQLSGSNVNITTEDLTASGSNVNIITPSFFLGSTTNNISSSNDDLSITTKNLTASGSSVEIQSPNFFLGSATSYISGSSSGLVMSSSEFRLDSTNLDIDSALSRIDLGSITMDAGTSAEPYITLNNKIRLDIDGNVHAIHTVGKDTFTDTTAGFFLGSDSDTAQVNIGDTNNNLKFDGSKFELTASSVGLSGSDVNITTENLTASGSNVNILTPSFFLGSSDNHISGSNNGLNITTGNATLSGSSVDILTPSFFLGSSDNHISGSSDGLQIQTSQATISGSSVEIATDSFLLGNQESFVSGSSTGVLISGSGVEVKTPNFFLGDLGTSFISSSGTQLRISSSNFSLENGNITASNVNLDGKITSVEGTIGGFTLGANKISSTNLVLSSSTTTTDKIISASNFIVTAGGQVTASNVRADGGTIGGFTITDTHVSASDLLLKSSGQITGSKVLLDGGNIGGFAIDSTRLTNLASYGSIDISAQSSSVNFIGFQSSSIGGQTTAYAMVGSFGQTWRGLATGYSGHTGIDIGRFNIVDGYKSLLRVDEVSQSLASWNFNETELYNGNVYLDSAKQALLIKDSLSRTIVTVGDQPLSPTSASAENEFITPSFETMDGFFTQSTHTDGDKFPKNSNFSNTRTITVATSSTAPNTGTKHFRISVGASVPQ